MKELSLTIHKSWLKELKGEFKKDYFLKLDEFLKSEAKKKKIILPPKEDIFNAFKLTPFNKVKIVILGQDPYHGINQSHGLAFSVKKETCLPPSLKNIFRELKDDLGVDHFKSGDLTSWAKEGVLLLNTILTVEEKNPLSHAKHGWEEFTNFVISTLNLKRENLVFILWGKPAQEKLKMIDSKRHLVLMSPHPSPLSSFRGFFGCKHFSLANKYLRENNISPVDF